MKHQIVEFKLVEELKISSNIGIIYVEKCIFTNMTTHNMCVCEWR